MTGGFREREAWDDETTALLSRARRLARGGVRGEKAEEGKEKDDDDDDDDGDDDDDFDDDAGEARQGRVWSDAVEERTPRRHRTEHAHRRRRRGGSTARRRRAAHRLRGRRERRGEEEQERVRGGEGGGREREGERRGRGSRRRVVRLEQAAEAVQAEARGVVTSSTKIADCDCDRDRLGRRGTGDATRPRVGRARTRRDGRTDDDGTTRACMEFLCEKIH